MNPNIYLAYMVFLGLEQESGIAKELAQSFANGKKHGLYQKMGWASNFDMLLNRVVCERERFARMNYIYEGVLEWSKVNSKSFIKFLETYGFKK